MITIRILVTILLSLFSFSVLAEPEWRQKPVQCGSSEAAMKILEEHGEKAIVGGLTRIKTHKGVTELQPFYLFVNTDTGTFTVIEYHIDNEEVCILAYGNGIDFEVEELFKPKTGT
jgi:hypothetical protein